MPPGEQVAEAGAGDVDVHVATLDEVHRHVERVIDVGFEAGAVLEHEGQLPARRLSVSRQTSDRSERKPVGRPSRNGELANSAVATGCSATATRSFFTMSASLAKS